MRATKTSEFPKPKAGNLLDKHVLFKQGAKPSLPCSLTLTNLSLHCIRLIVPASDLWQHMDFHPKRALLCSSSSETFVLVTDVLESSRKGMYCMSCTPAAGNQNTLVRSETSPDQILSKGSIIDTGHVTTPVNSEVSVLLCSSFSGWNNAHMPSLTKHMLIHCKLPKNLDKPKRNSS